MYSSHSLKKEGQQAKEENIDQRGNILNHPGIKYGIPVGALALVGSIYLGISSFSKMASSEPLTETPPEQTSSDVQSKQPGKPNSPQPEFDQSGTVRAYASGSFGSLVVTSQNILINPPAAKITPLTVEVFSPDGRLYTTEVRKNVQKNDSGFMGTGPTGGPK